MTDNPILDQSRLRADLAEAEAALRAFAEGPARETAEAISERFAQTGARIATSLSRAAADGRVTMKELAKAILEALAQAALPSLIARIEGGGGRGLALFGARATGGSVTPGGAYLVGERGPELFSPRAAGALTPAGGGAVSVTINISPGADAEGFLRHRGQIAAEIARAVSYGRRNL